MNNILLLTDLSAASFHASRYAALLTRQFRTQRLVIYHAYEMMMPLPVSDIPVSDITGASVSYPPQVFDQDGNEQRRKSLADLKGIYDSLQGLVYEGTQIEYKTEEATLPISINDIAKETGADMVVIAMTDLDTSKLERALFGNNTLHVADESHYPVLIVPPSAELAPVQRIVFACDLKKTKETTPIKGLKKLLDDWQAELMVVHVEQGEKNAHAEEPLNAALLDKWFAPYQPAFHYIDNRDAAKGIMEFAQARKASLIIAIHKHRDFIEGIFHSSATHQLAYKSPIPLLVMRAEEA